MDAYEVGRYWNDNAEAWTRLARQGFDIYRDLINTPAFLAMLPDIAGLTGLDIGCGEGSNTRQLVDRGAQMTGIDIARVVIEHARAAEQATPRSITYLLGNAQSLPFADASFDFATAFMSLMDLPDNEQAIAEAHRVIKPGGFLQFSILHPSFATPHFKKLRDDQGRTFAFELGSYFDRVDGQIDEWIFSAAPQDLRGQFRKFRIPRFHRTLSQWLNASIGAGFVIEQLGEPKADDAVIARHPRMVQSRVFPHFLHVRCRPP